MTFLPWYWAQFLGFVVLALSGRLSARIGVHFEEQHLGSFYHFGEYLELSGSYTLVLFDAHSDASSARSSDALRKDLRVLRNEMALPFASPNPKPFEEWRRKGRVQVFDWIEPLMPHPISKVLWVGPGSPGSREKEARTHLDRYQEQRNCGALGDRFQAISWEEFVNYEWGSEQVVVSLDLDVFAHLQGEEQRERQQETWSEILAIPGLCEVSVAVSSPWQRDQENAKELVEEQLRLIFQSAGTYLFFEPFAPEGEDRSELARQILAKGQRPSRFDVTTLSSKSAQLLARCQERIRVSYESERWQEWIRQVKSQTGGLRLAVDDHALEIDERVRVDSSTARPPMRIVGAVEDEVKSVEWCYQEAKEDSYNLLPHVSLGKTFTHQDHWLEWEEVVFARKSKGSALAVSWSDWTKGLQPYGFGSVRVYARVSFEDGTTQQTPLLEVRVLASREKQGIFRASLSEQFNLPYLFGIAGVERRGMRGPELGWGNDCANFLVWAWQQDGWALPWCNPGQLRPLLRKVGRYDKDGKVVKFTEEDLFRGLAIDRGSHFAALWEDREPLGELNEDDVVAHQLSGEAELITLAEFCEGYSEVWLRRRPNETIPTKTQLAFVGDLNFENAPSNALSELQVSSGFSGELQWLGNLECVLAEESELEGSFSHPRPEYQLVAEPVWAKRLAESGFTGVSLANNHSWDLGREGVASTRKKLKDAGVQFTGAGDNLTEALEPIRVGKHAVFAVNFINSETYLSSPDEPSIVMLPQHRGELKDAIASVRRDPEIRIIVMAHWGDEMKRQPNAEQRRWARQLIAWGVDEIYGSHPHVVQPQQYWRGRPVYFSLGNAVFPSMEIRGKAASVISADLFQ